VDDSALNPDPSAGLPLMSRHHKGGPEPIWREARQWPASPIPMSRSLAVVPPRPEKGCEPWRVAGGCSWWVVPRQVSAERSSSPSLIFHGPELY